MTNLTHLECCRCGKQIEARKPQNLCECGGPLLARYDLERARQGYSREWLDHAPSNLWRYMPLLPIANPGSVVSLGEGMTPLVRARRLGEALGVPNLWIKDDGVNPTGSTQARGFSCVISMALELNIGEVRICSGGDDAGALAAYAAAAGVEARMILPHDASPAIYVQSMMAGENVTLSEDSSLCQQGFDVGVFQEPYRLEGIKTLGYEVAEQSRWELPDLILCPAADGMELIGMWKAFEEMEALGWISSKRPRMVAVQAEAPRTLAVGLRVTMSPGEGLVRAVLDTSGGATVTVSDQEMLDAGIELARSEGVFAGLEGAACLAGLRKLLAERQAEPNIRILILNPSSGLKYLDAYTTRFPKFAALAQDKLGGLITPR